LGPQTACIPHLDLANLAFGYCAITSVGEFDPTKGGHLVLWDSRLVIEFPPGSTVLLSSAVLTHSNVPVASYERRYSFTQYCAGGLFRWVDNGFQTASGYQKMLNLEQRVTLKQASELRWKEGLALLPKLPFVSPSAFRTKILNKIFF
jgi:hypothetical protein